MTGYIVVGGLAFAGSVLRLLCLLDQKRKDVVIVSGRRAKALRAQAKRIDPGAPKHVEDAWYRVLKAEHKRGGVQ